MWIQKVSIQKVCHPWHHSTLDLRALVQGGRSQAQSSNPCTTVASSSQKASSMLSQSRRLCHHRPLSAKLKGPTCETEKSKKKYKNKTSKTSLNMFKHQEKNVNMLVRTRGKCLIFLSIVIHDGSLTGEIVLAQRQCCARPDSSILYILIYIYDMFVLERDNHISRIPTFVRFWSSKV